MTKVLFAVFLLWGFSAQVYADGIEIGNGKGGPDTVGGFEIGNGFLVNKVGLYKLSKVFGTWKADFFNRFTELTAISEDAIKTRASIDLMRSLDILSKSDLVKKMKLEGWTEVTNIPNITAMKMDSVSMSGIRKLEYHIFKGPGELVDVVLTGPQGDPGFSAFEQFQKTMESFELLG